MFLAKISTKSLKNSIQRKAVIAMVTEISHFMCFSDTILTTFQISKLVTNMASSV